MTGAAMMDEQVEGLARLHQDDAPPAKKTFVSNTPKSAAELLASLRILFREGRIEEARELLEYGYITRLY